MSFVYQFNLYTDPINKSTDRQYLILHLYNGDTVHTPIMIQYRGTVTGLFTVHIGTDILKGLMVTNSSFTTELNATVSNCTLILSNGNLYSCTMYDNDVLLSCQFPISIGDTSKLFSSVSDTFTQLHLSVDVNSCTGKILSSLEPDHSDELQFKELTMDEEIDVDEQSIGDTSVEDTFIDTSNEESIDEDGY